MTVHIARRDYVLVPNTTSAFLLRVYPDTIEHLPIVAWRILIFDAETDNESCVGIPITVEVDTAGSVDCVSMPNKQFIIPDTASFDTEDEAIEACREILRRRR